MYNTQFFGGRFPGKKSSAPTESEIPSPFSDLLEIK